MPTASVPANNYIRIAHSLYPFVTDTGSTAVPREVVIIADCIASKHPRPGARSTRASVVEPPFPAHWQTDLGSPQRNIKAFRDRTVELRASLAFQLFAQQYGPPSTGGTPDRPSRPILPISDPTDSRRATSAFSVAAYVMCFALACMYLPFLGTARKEGTPSGLP